MKILIINNVYPPEIDGGYSLICYNVAQSLKRRRHEVFILCGKGKFLNPKKIKPTEGISRDLFLETDNLWQTNHFTQFLNALKNLFAFKRIFKKVNPDIIYCWNLAFVPLLILNKIEACKKPVFHHFGANYFRNCPSPWQTFLDRQPKNFLRRTLKKIFIKFMKKCCLYFDFNKLNFKNLFCSCRYLKKDLIETGFISKNIKVLYEGIPTQKFLPKQNIKKKINPKDIKLLYVGRLVREKGPHTIILSLENLRNRGYKNIELTIIGFKFDKNYFFYLKKLVKKKKLNNNVLFKNPIPEEKLADVFRTHNILVFPSIWEEPWSLLLLEAMASGIAVIATKTGGSKEILKEGVNALTFEPENAEELSEKIIKLINNQSLFLRIKRNASNEVRKKFDIEKMVDRIELVMERAIKIEPKIKG